MKSAEISSFSPKTFILSHRPEPFMKQLLLLLLFCSNISLVQSSNDSLTAYAAKLRTQPASHQRDTALSKTLNLVARIYAPYNPDTAIIISKEALQLAQKHNWESGAGISLHQLGMFYINTGDNETAYTYFQQALSIWSRHEKSSDSLLQKNALKRKAATLNMLGIYYDNIGQYPRAIEHYLLSLKYHERNKNKPSMALVYGNIGLVYSNLDEFEKALTFHNKALDIDKELGNLGGVGRHMANIGMIYLDQGNLEKALETQLAALELQEKHSSPQEVGYNYGNIGNTYSQLASREKNTRVRDSLYKKALEYDNKAIRQLTEVGDMNGVARNTGNVGVTYVEMKLYNQAIPYLEKAIMLCDTMQMLREKMKFEIRLSNAYQYTGNTAKALEHYKAYSIAKDSIFNMEKDKELTSKQLNYEFEKKQAEEQLRSNAEKEKIQAIAGEEQKRQRLIIFSVAGILLLVIIFSGFLYSRFRITKKQKNIIEQQKHEVEHQKEIVEEKQKEIIDSITYAKRIQMAILATPESMHAQMPQSFLLYQPKDIVAGDFYFFERSGDRIFLAAADCTGHGVPGALVSVICANALTRCVREFRLTDPGQILDKTRELVVETFRKSGTNVQDGMDISLCCFNSGENIIRWAGANNPLWYTEAGEMKEIKANKQPIGLTENPLPFTTHEVRIAKNEQFFLFTDGYADQFGGPKGKKFKYTQLTQLLLSNKDLEAQKQKEILQSELSKWRGPLEQVDDICVIGVRM
jgi:serine phosphatase RsbU (regulator of sigma subunit)